MFINQHKQSNTWANIEILLLRNSQFLPDRWLKWKLRLHFLSWPHMQIDIRSGNSTYHFHFCSNLLLIPFVLPDIEERKKRRKKGDVFENEAKPRAWLRGDELSRRWGNVTSQPVSTKQSSCQSSKKLDHAWNTIWRFVHSPSSKLAQISSRSRTILIF